MGFFSDVGKWFKKAGQSISSGFKKVVNTVYSDVKSVVKFGGSIINKTTDLPGKIVDKGSATVQALGGDLKGIAGSLSMPLVLVGVGVLAFVMLKK